MSLEEQYEQIERYLAEALSPEEQQAFEARLQEDAALAREVKLHRELARSLNDEKVNALRGQLKNIDQGWAAPTDQQPTKRISLNWRQLAGVAAIIAIGILAYTFLNRGPASLTNDELFAQHFSPYRLVLDERSAAPSEADQLRAAISSYETGNYDQATERFQQLQNTAPDNVLYTFYTALSQLSNERPTEAIPLLQGLLQKGTHLFVQQSRWYLALAHLDNNDSENAKAVLRQIQEGDYQYEAAQAILATDNSE